MPDVAADFQPGQPIEATWEYKLLQPLDWRPAAYVEYRPWYYAESRFEWCQVRWPDGREESLPLWAIRPVGAMF